MNIHDLIVEELFEKKSLAAFMWLIMQGREMEASYNGKSIFISCSGSSEKVSIWIDKKEQAFKTIEDLVEFGEINEKRMIDIWDKIDLGILF